MKHSDSLPAARSACHDIDSCHAWLATAALGDARQACDAFLALLGELESAPPPRHAYLGILDLLLPRLLAGLSEQTRRMAGRPLPLAPSEEAAFGQVTSLWLALLRAYRRLLREAVDARPAESSPALANLAARATACAAELVAAHLMARREPGADQWQWLHASFAFAESRGISDIALKGMSNSAHAYVQAMLFALAQPQALSQRDMFWVRTWAQRFAPAVRICRSTAGECAYAVDLGGGGAVQWRPIAGLDGAITGHDSPWRFLGTEALAQALRRRLGALESGEEPAALGLGSYRQAGASTLLRQLLRAWCAAPMSPHFPRRETFATEAIVALGLAETHAALGGKPLITATRNWHYRGRDDEKLQGVHHSPAPSATKPAEREQHRWQVLDESASGFRLRRSLCGGRITLGQLLALQSGGLSRFLLSEVRWVRQDAGQSLTLGVMLLPGLPRPCAVRPHSDDPAHNQDYIQALLMSASKTAPASLVLPAGWYQHGRLLELQLDDGASVIRLSGLAGRGFDYDRASFGEPGVRD